MRRIVLAMVVVASLAACTSDGPLPPLALTNPPAEPVAGETIDLSGEGCPPDGPVPLAQPQQVGVELMPLRDGPRHDQIGYLDPDGELALVGYALMEEGAGAQHHVVDEDGRWSGTRTLPNELRPGEWQLLVSCLTLVDEDQLPAPPGLLPADGTTVVRTYVVG